MAGPKKASHISFLNLVQQKWHTWGFGVVILALFAGMKTASEALKNTKLAVDHQMSWLPWYRPIVD